MKTGETHTPMYDGARQPPLRWSGLWNYAGVQSLTATLLRVHGSKKYWSTQGNKRENLMRSTPAFFKTEETMRNKLPIFLPHDSSYLFSLKIQLIILGTHSLTRQ